MSSSTPASLQVLPSPAQRKPCPRTSLSHLLPVASHHPLLETLLGQLLLSLLRMSKYKRVRKQERSPQPSRKWAKECSELLTQPPATPSFSCLLQVLPQQHCATPLLLPQHTHSSQTFLQLVSSGHVCQHHRSPFQLSIGIFLSVPNQAGASYSGAEDSPWNTSSFSSQMLSDGS